MERLKDSVAFVIHPKGDAARRAADLMRLKLVAEGVSVFFPQHGERADACRMVLTFGGDGTLLSGARTALEYECPLLGINLGTMGFLTEGDPEHMDRLKDCVLQGQYTIEERGLLSIRTNRNPERFLALNDAVVTRGGFARLIQVETRVNHEHWGTFIADGVIAATPTGSTGYSLSAGGPVIAPGVDCIAITPVCAHSLQHCPCIVPLKAEIQFRLRAEREQRAELQIDGVNMGTIQAGDTVYVTGAEEKLKLVRTEPYRFFRVLQRKLNEWSQPKEDRS